MTNKEERTERIIGFFILVTAVSCLFFLVYVPTYLMRQLPYCLCSDDFILSDEQILKMKDTDFSITDLKQKCLSHNRTLDANDVRQCISNYVRTRSDRL